MSHKFCSTCQYRDVNFRYCFNSKVSLSRYGQLEQIKTKGLLGICDLYVENTEPLIGEINKEPEAGDEH